MLDQDGRMGPDQAPPAGDDEVQTFVQLQEEAQRLARVRRECPVPKPRGRLGEILGFKSRGDEQQQEEGRAELPHSDASDSESRE